MKKWKLWRQEGRGKTGNWATDWQFCQPICVGLARGGLSRGVWEEIRRIVTLRFILIFLALLALVCWVFSDEARAAEGSAWAVREVPVSVRAGDQISPVLDGNSVIFSDMTGEPGGRLMMRNLAGGEEKPLFTPGVAAGPAADAGAIVWQTQDLQVCRGILSDSSRSCLALPSAARLSLSGDKAVTSHDDSIIRLVNFETMRSRMLDSSTNVGRRYDPDIDGDRAVWIKERGYAGKYYEPLIVSYDLLTDTQAYITKLGGGATEDGWSIYERRHPSLDGGRIFYQQRMSGAGNQWDIFEAVPDSFGVPLVEMPGDQIHPSLSGNLVVYQDNRGGYLNDAGEWTGEWDVYLMDLETGLETPVTTSPGDQVNPVIKGNVIVWEDNRNGNWDIYAAVLTPADGEPELGLATDAAYWRNYADYFARILTARYRIRNSGEGPALQVSVRRAISTPGTVTVSTILPLEVGDIAAGQQAPLEIRFNVPAGVARFRTSLFASCRDGAGQELWFPAPPDA